MKVTRTLLAAALLLCFFQNQAQTLRGTVRDAATGEVLIGANLRLQSKANTALPGAVTDTAGAYVIRGMRPGYYTLEIIYGGYKPMLIQEINLVAGKETLLDIPYNQSVNLPVFSIFARSERSIRPLPTLGVVPLSREQTLRFPATFFDPARLAQAYAGVTNHDDQANGLSVRGANPAWLRWRLDGVDIVNPNHLPNAGTVGDRPVAASGGVLMFSAQLLDNSSLLTGNYPAGYGDALGGVMDMNLRRGNATQPEFTAQAGLLGLDLAAEGPLSRKSGAAYLANYRYSTVGLLGEMGISFGDEQINFQDLSFKFNFPTRRGGEWSVFGLGGLNENVFQPKADSADVEQYKDFFHIDFNSRTGLAGLSNWSPLGDRSWLKVTAIASGQRNERTATGLGLDDRDENTEERLGLAATFSHQFNRRHRLLMGFNFQNLEYALSVSRSGQALQNGRQTTVSYQSWAEWRWNSRDERTSASVGLHASWFNLRPDSLRTDAASYEPRLALTRHFGAQQRLTLAYGLHSQLQAPWLYASTMPGDNVFGRFWNKRLGLTKAHHLGLRYAWDADAAWTYRGELFYQRLFELPVSARRSDALSLLNVNEIGPLDSLVAAGAAETKGLELTAERRFDGVWFLLANLTLLDADYRPSDQRWQPSRWSIGHLVNLTAGREWSRERRPGRVRAFGFNGHLIWHGGYRELPVDAAASAAAQATVYDTRAGFSVRQPAFFRLDGRVYWRTSLGNRRNSTFAMDFQNLTMQENVAYRYYDPYTRKVETKYQLGLIPNLSWRLEW